MKSHDGSLLQNAAYLGLGLASTIISTLSDRTRNKANWTRDKVVVITGGSRGLGLALAEEFGRRGAQLVLNARNEGQLAEARRLLVDRGAVPSAEDVLIVPADLRNPEDASRLIDEATRRFGRVDVLINNAGVITVGPIENQSLEQFREVMDSNFFSGLHCTMAVLPQMLERRAGSIANVTSIGGRVAVHVPGEPEPRREQIVRLGETHAVAVLVVERLLAQAAVQHPAVGELPAVLDVACGVVDVVSAALRERVAHATSRTAGNSPTAGCCTGK